jgi:hypothetical protein
MYNRVPEVKLLFFTLVYSVFRKSDPGGVGRVGLTGRTGLTVTDADVYLTQVRKLQPTV